MSEPKIVYSRLQSVFDIEPPWWFKACTHRDHGLIIYDDGDMFGCWQVLEEQEGMAVLLEGCMGRLHILVSRPGLGSICTTRPVGWYTNIERPDFNRFIQGQLKELKSIQVPELFTEVHRRPLDLNPHYQGLE